MFLVDTQCPVNLYILLEQSATCTKETNFNNREEFIYLKSVMNAMQFKGWLSKNLKAQTPKEEHIPNPSYQPCLEQFYTFDMNKNSNWVHLKCYHS